MVHNEKFPLPQEVRDAFDALKLDVEDSVTVAIDEEAPFQVETDASEFALAGTLNQNGRPVAFFSRTLSKAESKHSAVEKEAAAIIESVRKWKHYLSGNKKFTLITDQRSVAYMFDSKHKGKKKKTIKSSDGELNFPLTSLALFIADERRMYPPTRCRELNA